MYLENYQNYSIQRDQAFQTISYYIKLANRLSSSTWYIKSPPKIIRATISSWKYLKYYHNLPRSHVISNHQIHNTLRRQPKLEGFKFEVGKGSIQKPIKTSLSYLKEPTTRNNAILYQTHRQSSSNTYCVSITKLLETSNSPFIIPNTISPFNELHTVES